VACSLPEATFPKSRRRSLAATCSLNRVFEIGWLGFPAVSRELCFFSGRISAFQLRILDLQEERFTDS
jgi:hypothetical protein